MSEKRCTKCGQTKPLEDFGRYRARCKPCHAADVREYKRSHQANVKRRQRERRAAIAKTPESRAKRAAASRRAYAKNVARERRRAAQYAKSHRAPGRVVRREPRDPHLCSQCGETKPLTAFGSAGKGRRRTQCKPCHVANVREYKRSHPPTQALRAFENARRRLKRDKAKHAARMRAAYARNAQRERLRTKRYLKAHPEVRRRSGLTRRARRFDAFVESVDPAVVFKRDKGRCGICFQRVKKSEASIDHIVPLAKGGAHSYANVQLAHLRCNSSKNTKTIGQLRIAFEPDAIVIQSANVGGLDVLLRALLALCHQSFGNRHAAGPQAEGDPSPEGTSQERLPITTMPLLFRRLTVSDLIH